MHIMTPLNGVFSTKKFFLRRQRFLKNRYDMEAEIFWEHSSHNYAHNVMGVWDNSYLKSIHVAFCATNFL